MMSLPSMAMPRDNMVVAIPLDVGQHIVQFNRERFIKGLAFLGFHGVITITALGIASIGVDDIVILGQTIRFGVACHVGLRILRHFLSWLPKNGLAVFVTLNENTTTRVCTREIEYSSIYLYSYYL